MSLSTAHSFQSAGCTQRGLARHTNQDAFLDRPDLGLWAVADGMGGLDNGNVASRHVIEVLDGLTLPNCVSAAVADVVGRLRQANDTLRARRHASRAMGSTVAAMLASEGRYACVWAGDSRAYLLRDGSLRRLTRDHSLVQHMLDDGDLSLGQAGSHHQASAVYRAVGVANALELDVVEGVLRTGDCFLLCSDGLTRLLTDEDLALALLAAEHSGSPLPVACSTLLVHALMRGAVDDVTLILVRVTIGDNVSSGQQDPEPTPRATRLMR